MYFVQCYFLTFPYDRGGHKGNWWIQTKQNERRKNKKTTHRLIHHGTENGLIDDAGADNIDDANDALSPTNPDPPLNDDCQDEWAVSVLSELQVDF